MEARFIKNRVSGAALSGTMKLFMPPTTRVPSLDPSDDAALFSTGGGLAVTGLAVTGD
jgi:hypothetical protein